MRSTTRTIDRRLHAVAIAVIAAVVMALAAPSSASAETFIDPDDPCLGEPGAAPFADRDEVIDVHLNNVDCAFDAGIIVGETKDGERFLRPGSSVTRAQMATIVVGALEHAGYNLPGSTPDAFTDDDESVHEANINTLAAIGIVEGVSDGRYQPQAQVTRAQMLTMMVQAAEVAYGTQFEPVTANPFTDVPDSNVHRDNIIVGSNVLGITAGSSENQFDPSADTRRDWMATFITRLVDMILIDAETPADDPASGPTIDDGDIDRDVSG